LVPFSTRGTREPRLIRRVYLSRLRSAFRGSHPLGVLLPREPCGLISCRWRSWGCPLQSFPLRTEPLRLSTLATLMALGVGLGRARNHLDDRQTRGSANQGQTGLAHLRFVLPAFRAWYSAGVRRRSCGVNRATDPMLSWGSGPLQGFTTTRPCDGVSTAAPSMGFTNPTSAPPRGVNW